MSSTLTVPAQRRPAHPAPEGCGRVRCPLPAWPVLALFIGFPLFWVTGTSVIAPQVLAGVMLVLLTLRGRLRLAPGALLWAALLFWIGVCALPVDGTLHLLGFLKTASDLVAVGVVFLYYVNARKALGPRQVLAGLAVLWTTVVGLGFLALVLPDVRLTTPFALVMPESLRANDLVRDLVMPRLAEVQQPWGAPAPFERPAAPFPYTNSWGMAYAMLTPVMVLIACHARRTLTRVLIAAAVLASVLPAVRTSNRGMMLALLVLAVFLVARFLLDGRLLPTVAVAAGPVAAAVLLQATGVFAAIAERQHSSDTTGDRGRIYLATLEKIGRSPLIGWATPGNDPTLGIALGTQGYAWTLMYSYGLPGLVLFLLFLGRVLLASVRLHGTTVFVFQGLVVMVLATIWFYGLGATQCLVLVLVCAMLARAVADGQETLDDH